MAIIACHGTPGSRQEYGDPAILNKLNARLIVVDRPGFGLSDFADQRTLVDWPSDVAQLADTLGLDRFAVIGYSGGGPFAAACAYRHPERITGTTLVSSLAPFDVAGLTDHMPPSSLALFELAARDHLAAEQRIADLIDTPETLFRFMEQSATAVYKPMFNAPDFARMYKRDMAECLRQGLRGMAYDMSIVANPWGFDPAEITTPVLLWHGTADANVPVEMGRYLWDSIPHASAQIFPVKGHYLMFEYWEQVLQELTDNS
jgi:pimeloyl-ACP methyl ester carboxylesterase